MNDDPATPDGALPCPFCGSPAGFGEDANGYAVIGCTSCSANIPMEAFTNGGREYGRGLTQKERADAVADWNRRA